MDIHVIKCDLADLNSIKEFVAEYKKLYKIVDILINNAGKKHFLYI